MRASSENVAEDPDWWTASEFSILGTTKLGLPLKQMARYFFDFRSYQAFSQDDEGLELLDADAAHNEALNALSDALPDIVIQGATDQNFAVEVRDDLGPVLEVTAVLGSTIFRKQ